MKLKVIFLFIGFLFFSSTTILGMQRDKLDSVVPFTTLLGKDCPEFDPNKPIHIVTTTKKHGAEAEKKLTAVFSSMHWWSVESKGEHNLFGVSETSFDNLINHFYTLWDRQHEKQKKELEDARKFLESSSDKAAHNSQELRLSDFTEGASSETKEKQNEKPSLKTSKSNSKQHSRLFNYNYLWCGLGAISFFGAGWWANFWWNSKK